MKRVEGVYPWGETAPARGLRIRNTTIGRISETGAGSCRAPELTFTYHYDSTTRSDLPFAKRIRNSYRYLCLSEKETFSRVGGAKVG